MGTDDYEMCLIGEILSKIKWGGGFLNPLSPLEGCAKVIQSPHTYFFFVWRGFSILLKQAQQENLIRGVKFGSDGPHVTHLLFADDSVLFVEATAECMHTLKGILQDYKVSLGQRVNLSKSSIFFGNGVPVDVKNAVKAQIL